MKKQITYSGLFKHAIICVLFLFLACLCVGGVIYTIPAPHALDNANFYEHLGRFIVFTIEIGAIFLSCCLAKDSCNWDMGE